MKIVLPVDEKEINSPICVSFGRTPYFMSFDTENNNYDFIENTAADSPGGAGIKASQIIADNKADAVITYRCGENAAEVLNKSEIKIYKAVEGNASENIEKFKNGELIILSEIHAGFHNHGGN